MEFGNVLMEERINEEDRLRLSLFDRSIDLELSIDRLCRSIEPSRRSIYASCFP